MTEPPRVSGRTPAEILEGLTVPTSEPGVPGGTALDIPIPLNDAWRQFLETYGTGEVPTRGSALQVGGQIAIVVQLETLLGINAPPAPAASIVREHRRTRVQTNWAWLSGIGAASETFTVPEVEGAVSFRLARLELTQTAADTVNEEYQSYFQIGSEPLVGTGVVLEDCFWSGEYMGDLDLSVASSRAGTRGSRGPGGNTVSADPRLFLPVNGRWWPYADGRREYVINIRRLTDSGNRTARATVEALWEIQIPR